MEVIYEGNYIITVDKICREIVQDDKTGSKPLSEMLKAWLRKKYHKPGNIFVGVTHRLGRLVNGVVIFTRTSKALSCLNKTFRADEVRKMYQTIVKNRPPQSGGELVDWLVWSEKQNESYAHDTEWPSAKKATLRHKLVTHSGHYYLLEIDLKMGRHHQIRCQLAKMGYPIGGDLRYGFDRSNRDGGTSLHARSAEFVHPVSKENVRVVAPVPDGNLWKASPVDRQ